MTPRVKPPHTLVSVLHWLWYCRATALSALANLTLLLRKNTLPFPVFGNLNFVSPPHRRAYTSIPKSCPNIRFPHQQDFFPIIPVTMVDKILYKNLDLIQDFPNKILFHSLWEQNLVQNLPKIFRLPEMYSFGKILAQDFQMAAITKILMRRENQLRRFFPWGISDKQKTENT